MAVDARERVLPDAPDFGIMGGMKQIVTATAAFERMREKDVVYVDKTAYFYRLLQRDPDTVFFIARPRRFGKSLMINTLTTLLQGKRDYFRGLAIDGTDYDWGRHKVIRLRMTDACAATPEGVRAALQTVVALAARELGLPHDPSIAPEMNFLEMLSALPSTSETGRFAVLVDEYDAPLNAFIDEPEKFKAVQQVLHDFYVKMKDHQDNMRFVMVTGVTKLAKMSIFSGFNNPTDLTLEPDFAGMLGYTHDEVERYFHEQVQAFAEKEGISYEAMKARLFAWYDSYRFSPESDVKVVNPFSFGSALNFRRLSNYWEKSGNSGAILKRIRAAREIPSDLNGAEVSRSALDTPNPESEPLSVLMYHSGYLTIDGAEDGIVSLRIPNEEIADSISHGYIAYCLRDRGDEFAIKAQRTGKEIAEKGISYVGAALRAAFAMIPYEWICKDEAEAKRYFLLFCKFMKADISGERQSARGRADAVLKTPQAVYVFEFKHGRSAAEAVAQARTKDYGGPDAAGDRPVYLVGVNYNPETRTIDEPLVEPL